MYARILEGWLRGSAGEEALTYFRLSVAPALRRQPGFVGGRLFSAVGRTDAGRTTAGRTEWLVLLLWETEHQRAEADADAVLQTLLGHLTQYFEEPLRSRWGEQQAQVGTILAGLGSTDP
jgi:hypothetical protein